MQKNIRFTIIHRILMTIIILSIIGNNHAVGQVAGYLGFSGGSVNDDDEEKKGYWVEFGAYGNIHRKLVLGAKHTAGLMFIDLGYSLVTNDYINIYPAISFGSDLGSSSAIDASFGIDLYEGHKLAQNKRSMVLGLRLGIKSPINMQLDTYQEGFYFQLRYGSI